MKIGIYNRYWNTCGGGENYTGSLAEVLSQYFEVELISVEDTDWSRIQDRLRLDLSRCSKAQWPNVSCEKLSYLTTSYDVFVNSTYGSSIFPQSELSSLICYFPHKVRGLTGLARRIKFYVNSIWDKYLNKNQHEDFAFPGAYGLEPDGRLWISNLAILPIVKVNERNQIILSVWPDAYCGLHRVIFNNKNCEFEFLDSNLVIKVDEQDKVPGNLVLYSKPFVPSESGDSTDSRRLGICFDTSKEFFSIIDFKSEATWRDPKKTINSYDDIISISKFTTNWIARRWGRAEVAELFPPIDTEVFNVDLSNPRDNIILSVGRFFAGGHNKKHLEMARAFIKLREKKIIPEEWRFVMIGSRHKEHKEHLEYFETLIEVCRGHPIDILPDLAFPKLLEFYKKASIYWHFAGYGERENSNPERFEHFGMTTCEAMASGCIPVVFNGAGQREIVEHKHTGYLFKNETQLESCMSNLMSLRDKELAALRVDAQDSIQRYSKKRFRENTLRIFNNLMSRNNSLCS